MAKESSAVVISPRLKYWWFLLLIIISAIPRLYALRYMEYQADEAHSVYAVTAAIKNHYFSPLGLVSSTGVNNLPFFHYVLVLPTLVSADPLFLASVIALTNSVLIGFFYLVTRRFYSPFIGIVSGLFIATAPWQIIFSRKIWSVDQVLLFALPILWLLESYWHKPQARYLFWLGFVSSLNAQLHLPGIFFFLALTIVLAVRRVKPLRSYIYGTALGLIFALPYMYYQVTSTPRCPDCLNYLSFLRTTPTFFTGEHISSPLFTLTGFGWPVLMGTDYLTFRQLYPFLPISYLGFVLVLLFIIVGFIVAYRERRHRWLLAIIGLTLAFMFMTRQPAYLHYYQSLVPFIALIAALGVSASRFNHRRFTLLGFFTIITGNLIFIFTFYRYLIIHPVLSGSYGPAYVGTSAWVNTALSLYPNRSDINELKLAAHFSIAAFPLTSLADVHVRLAHYFVQKEEWSNVRQELTWLQSHAPTHPQIPLIINSLPP